MSNPMMSMPADEPVVSDDAPVVSDDAPVVSDDAPVVSDDAPIVSNDAPVVSDNASPVTVNPASSNVRTAPPTGPDGQVNLLAIPINDENDALNVIIGFLSIAQRRGIFAINESAKIFECVKKFHKQQ